MESHLKKLKGAITVSVLNNAAYVLFLSDRHKEKCLMRIVNGKDMLSDPLNTSCVFLASWGVFSAVFSKCPKDIIEYKKQNLLEKSV